MLSEHIHNNDELHKAICNGDLNKVGEFLMEQQKKPIFQRIKSTFYVKNSIYQNNEMQSALFTAIKAQQYGIYAFLKSQGIVFKDEQEEEECIKSLKASQKKSLRDALIPYFSQMDNAHIMYLLAKSRSLGPVKDFQKRAENIY